MLKTFLLMKQKNIYLKEVMNLQKKKKTTTENSLDKVAYYSKWNKKQIL